MLKSQAGLLRKTRCQIVSEQGSSWLHFTTKPPPFHVSTFCQSRSRPTPYSPLFTGIDSLSFLTLLLYSTSSSVLEHYIPYLCPAEPAHPTTSVPRLRLATHCLFPHTTWRHPDAGEAISRPQLSSSVSHSSSRRPPPLRQLSSVLISVPNTSRLRL